METSPSSTSIRSRALITAGAVIAMLVGFRILLPGVDAGGAREFVARFGVATMFSIYGLGVMPILTSAFVLEILKLIAPRLRVWESASARNATLMQRIWFVFSMALATAQAYGAASGMMQANGIVSDPQTFIPLAVASLVGATALLFWLALIVTRRGLVTGHWLLFATQMIASAPVVGRLPSLDSADRTTALGVMAAWLVGVAALAAVGARLSPSDEPDRAGALIWPAVIGYYGAGMVQAAAILSRMEFFAGRIPHLALFAALALLTAFMRSPASETREGMRARLVLTLAQVAAVGAGSIALGALALPAVFNPIAIVVTAAVLQTIVQNARRT